MAKMRFYNIVTVTIFFICIQSSSFYFVPRHFRGRTIPLYKLCPANQCNGSYVETTNSKSSNCRCDPLCTYSGDCCADVPAAGSINISTSMYSHSPGNCVPFPSSTSSTSFYIRNYCHEETHPRGMLFSRTHCHDSSNYIEQVRRPMIKVPVTDRTTGVTYGNMFCASCGDFAKKVNFSYFNIRLADTQNLSFWDLQAQCETKNETILVQPKRIGYDLFQWTPPNYEYNSNYGLWQTKVNNKTENCTLTPSIPGNVTVSEKLRKCNRDVTNVISNCSQTNHSMASKCPGFQSLVKSPLGKIYRNDYCGLCNGEDVDNLHCLGLPIRYITIPSINFNRTNEETLLPLENKTTEAIKPSTSTSVAPTRATSSVSTTRPTTIMPSPTNTPLTTSMPSTTITPLTTTTPSSTNTPSPPTTRSSPKSTQIPTKTKAYMVISFNENCDNTLRTMNFTKVIAQTVQYTKMHRTYVRNKTKIRGKTVKICDMSDPTLLIEIEQSEELIMRYLVLQLAGFFILVGSSILLLIHLYEFWSPNASRTHNQKILASFALALFITNVGHLLSEYLADFYWNTLSLCELSYATEYFGCLAMYFWSTTMAFEIMRNVWEVKNNFQVTERGGESGISHFTVYSGISWIGAGTLTALKIMLRGIPNSFVFCSYRYEFDELRFLTYPLVISLSMNSTFYICALYMVRTQKQISSNLFKLRGIDLNLHTNLIIFSTLMWISLHAEATTTEWRWLLSAWIIFKLLNFILAFIIFLHSPIQNVLSLKLRMYLNKHFMWVIFEE